MLRAKEASCSEVAEAYLERIEAIDPTYGCFLAIDPESVMAQAAKAQSQIDRGEAGPLTGVPIAVKDNIATAGLETTCASKMLTGFVPPFDAFVVERLRGQGAVVLGKTNLDEFAMGASTENSAFKVTRNPWDPARSPGGSSGGSAAAVAARLAPAALGSDTGGSIRQPAALCGVVGFKPTYGRCSRYGLVAFGSSLDQIGPLARSVKDAALVAEAITGHDPQDGTSLDALPISAAEIEHGSLRGLKIGLVREMFGEALDPGVRESINAAVRVLETEGVRFERISIPSVSLGVSTYYIIAPAEASSNLARFDGVRYGMRAKGSGHIGLVERTRAEGFGHEVKSRIMIGSYALSAGYYDAYYLRAQRVRALMAREFEQAFQGLDAILSPACPVPAFKIGELNKDPLAIKQIDYCTIPANMAGLPGISLNCGFAENLPVGLQLLAAPMRDESLLQMAHSVERALPNATRAAPIP